MKRLFNWYAVAYQDDTTFGIKATKVSHDPEKRNLSISFNDPEDHSDPIYKWLRECWDSDNPAASYPYVDALVVVGYRPELKHLWKFQKVSCVSVNFGELDHSNSDPLEIELLLKYEDCVTHEVKE